MGGIIWDVGGNTKTNYSKGIGTKPNNETQIISLNIGLKLLPYLTSNKSIIIEDSRILLELMFKKKPAKNSAINHHLLRTKTL